MGIAADPTILRDFAEESRELISRLETGLAELAKSPRDQETINQVFRAWHTIKGCAAFLELHAVVALSHAAEGALNAARHAVVALDAGVLEVLRRAAEETARQITEVEAGREARAADEAVMAALSRLAEGKALGDSPSSVAEQPRAAEQIVSDESLRASETPAAATIAESEQCVHEPQYVMPASDSIIQVPVARFDAIMDAAADVRRHANERHMTHGSESRATFEAESAAALGESARKLDRIARNLGAAVAAARMLPLRRVLARCPKIAADVSASSGKEIEVSVSCGGIEVDQPVARVIGESLVHLVRNAADHGLESGEDRVAAGKGKTGVIWISTTLAHGRLFVEVRDDGRGLSRERIGSAAVKRGLATGDEIRGMSDEGVFRFVFEPGFSTAERVTEVSGRGVGMDAVRAGVERMRGTISLASTPGRGTTVTISIPIAAARVEAILVERSGGSFALRLQDVVRVTRQRGERRGESKSVEPRGTRVRVLDLGGNGAAGGESRATSRFVVVVRHGELVGAIKADRVYAPERITLRSGPRGSDPESERGLLAVAPDGRVIQLLDAAVLLGGSE